MMTPAMQRAAESIAAACLSPVVQADHRPPARDLDEEIVTGRFPQAMEGLRGLFQTVAMHEGILVQQAFGIPFAHDETHRFLVGDRAKRVAVTETERDFLARNPDADLDAIAPPAPGQPIGMVEVDVVVYDRATRELHLVDVKRSPRRGDSLASLRLASLALRREVQVQRPIVATRLTLLRWFSNEPARPRPAIVTREMVDQHFAIPVRETVDHAVRHYRQGVAARLQRLLDRPAERRPPVLDAARPDDEWEAEVLAFRSLLDRTGNSGRRA